MARAAIRTHKEDAIADSILAQKAYLDEIAMYEASDYNGKYGEIAANYSGLKEITPGEQSEKYKALQIEYLLKEIEYLKQRKPGEPNYGPDLIATEYWQLKDLHENKDEKERDKHFALQYGKEAVSYFEPFGKNITHGKKQRLDLMLENMSEYQKEN